MFFECHACGYRREIPVTYAGKTVKCPKCKESVVVGDQPEKAAGSSGHTISEFLDKTSLTGKGSGLFELESDRLLQINLHGRVWTKMGSMIAYTGDIKFTREGMMEHGVSKFLKKAVTGEGIQLTKAEGEGCLCLADGGKKISVLNLQGESICVNGNDLLAFQDNISWDIKLMKKVSGMLAGGLFNVNLQGKGMVAITTHHDPHSFKVTPGSPIFTDPNATVAWSGNLNPELKTDISFRTLLGRGSGESFQMKFQGSGFVIIQPFEEVYFQAH